MPPTISTTAVDGTEVVFSGTVQQAGIDIPPPVSAKTVVKSDRILDLSLIEDLDPVVPNGVLSYTLRFGNHSSATPTADTTLSMPIPAGTTFVSASGGGTVVNGAVEWSLGGLNAGQSGTRQLQVRVDPAGSAGLLINGEASLSDLTLANTAQASILTRVAASVPLGLSIVLNPDPVQPGKILNAAYNVTNLSNGTLLGVKLNAGIPGNVDAFAEALSTGRGGGGACPDITTATLCAPREHMT